MSQRSRAGLLATLLTLALWGAAALVPLPYVTTSPGPTVDILSKRDGKEIVQVSGAKTYRDNGEIRLTTVYVSQPEERVNLIELMQAWASSKDSVRPRSEVYAPETTDEEKKSESAVQMVSSQDVAIAVALRALDHKVRSVVEVQYVTPDTPADGKLELRDILLSVGGHPIRTTDDIAGAMQNAKVGKPLEMVVRRGGSEKTISITPVGRDGMPFIGIYFGPGYEFPFDVHVDVGDNIGGPSAGLMFSLAIYDTLTPGSLTDGESIAGTGTLDPAGKVGPIGGIAQKIVGARDAGAELFLVPPDNCADLVGVDSGEMRLMKATDFNVALQGIVDWTKDHDAELPTCEDVQS